jgi:hypothetical protein
MGVDGIGPLVKSIQGRLNASEAVIQDFVRNLEPLNDQKYFGPITQQINSWVGVNLSLEGQKFTMARITFGHEPESKRGVELGIELNRKRGGLFNLDERRFVYLNKLSPSLGLNSSEAVSTALTDMMTRLDEGIAEMQK